MITFGFSARDAVAGLPVRDGYPLRHGGGATTTLSVGIESADLGEVVWVKRSYGGSEELRFPCPEALLFRGVVRFRSEDGTYDERLETPILVRRDLASPRQGPCIIEEYDATCLVPPGAAARLDEHGNIVVQLG